MNRSIRGKLGAVALIAAAGLTLSGCELPANATYEPPKAGDAAHAGGLLKVGVVQPQAIEPGQAYDADGRMIAATMCDTLLTQDAETGEIKPGLAASWRVGSGGQAEKAKIFITLRRDLRFSNGTEVTAGLVSRSLKRLADPDESSNVADVLSGLSGYDVYHNRTKVGGTTLTSLASIRAIDKWSLEIELDQPMPDFFRVFTDPATAPIDVDAAERDPAKFAAQPVCAGPYKLENEFRKDTRELSLVRTKDYKPASAASTREGKGWADRISVRIYRNGQELADAYQRGEIDLARLAPDASLPAETKALINPGTMLDYVAFPEGGLGDAGATAVRQALSQALDRKALAGVSGQERRSPATGFLPPAVGEAAYRDDACTSAPAVGGAEQAKKALAGAPLPKSVNLYFNDEFNQKAVAGEIARQWQEKLGIQVVPTPLGGADYIDKVSGKGGVDGPFLMSWDEPTAPRQSNYLKALFGPELPKANLVNYETGLAKAVFDTRRGDLASEPAAVKRFRIMEDEACKTLRYVPLTLHNTRTLVRAETVGYKSGILTDRWGRVSLREPYLLNIATTPTKGAAR